MAGSIADADGEFELGAELRGDCERGSDLANYLAGAKEGSNWICKMSCIANMPGCNESEIHMRYPANKARPYTYVLCLYKAYLRFD